jgi:hypothetical protein
LSQRGGKTFYQQILLAGIDTVSAAVFTVNRFSHRHLGSGGDKKAFVKKYFIILAT